MPQFVLRDVPADLWARMGRDMSWRGLSRHDAMIEAIKCFCWNEELQRLNQQGGDKVASVPMGAKD